MGLDLGASVVATIEDFSVTHANIAINGSVELIGMVNYEVDTLIWDTEGAIDGKIVVSGGIEAEYENDGAARTLTIGAKDGITELHIKVYRKNEQAEYEVWADKTVGNDIEFGISL